MTQTTPKRTNFWVRTWLSSCCYRNFVAHTFELPASLPSLLSLFFLSLSVLPRSSFLLWIDRLTSSTDCVFAASILIKLGESLTEAIRYFERYFAAVGYENPLTVANYLEALRLNGDAQAAVQLGERLAARPAFAPSASTSLFYFNLGVVQMMGGDHRSKAMGNFELSLQYDPRNLRTWKQLIELAVDLSLYERAEQLARQALTFLPENYVLIYLLGVAVHQQKRLDEAVELYQQSFRRNSSFYSALANLGAAYQGLGKVNEAVRCYEQVIPHLPYDAGKTFRAEEAGERQRNAASIVTAVSSMRRVCFRCSE